MVQKKKIFDIIPPKEFKAVSAQPPASRKSFSFSKKVPTSRKSFSFPSFKKAPVFIGILIILTGLAGCLFIEPKAEVEIWPKTEKVNFQTQVMVKSSLLEENDQNIIPGEIFKIEKTFSQEFSATGTKSKSFKAHGTIRVYNEYSTYSQTLMATTRFVSDGGKLFRTPERALVPGAHYEGGKLVPGFVDIEVVAQEPGEDYNIGPSTFSIPGFAGTARYTAFYAKSFEPMTGGQITEVSQVTQEDIDQAKKVLSEKSLKESKAVLEGSISFEEYVLLEETISQKVVEITPLIEAGQEVGEFFCQVRTKSQALAFKESELRNFAKEYILAQMPEGKELQENSLQIEYFSQKVDLKENKIDLGLEISAQIYTTVDQKALKEMIKNRKVDGIKTLLQDFSEINKVQARFWPFWITAAPQNEERINIELRLD